jgi:predicted amidohydrolase YtcJ
MEQIVLASIITLNSSQPRAEAVLVSNRVVRFVGSREDCLAIAPKAEILEYRDAFLTPGLTDAHIHLTGYGFSLAALDLSACQSLEQGLALIATRAGGTTWLQGGGMFPNRWSETLYPTAADLDTVAPNQPVFIRSRDGHGAWVNSKALELAGVHAGTPDPEGGRIVRDKNGNPTGMLLEPNAMNLVRQVIPVATLEESVIACARACTQLEAWGYTSVHTMALEPANYLRAVQELEQRGALPLQVWASIPHADLEHVEATGLRGGTGDLVKICGIKFFADGALGSRTAWMFEPYLGTTQTGVIADPPELILERGRRALEMGFTPVVHAIGDRANHEVLNVLEALKPLADARGLRLRLEHAQHLSPADIARFGKLGIVASVQAIHLVDDAVPVFGLLGATRAKTTYPFRTLLETGATLALGSDASVATPEPRLGLEAAVKRLGLDGQPFMIEQCLTPLEALHGYTTGAAKAAGWENWYGQVKQGYKADFTLWETDPSLTLAKPIKALRL